MSSVLELNHDLVDLIIHSKHEVITIRVLIGIAITTYNYYLHRTALQKQLILDLVPYLKFIWKRQSNAGVPVKIWYYAKSALSIGTT